MAKGSAVLSGERSAWLVGLGVGLCIAATEVQRYTVMWPSSLYTTTAQERFIWLLGFLTPRGLRSLLRCGWARAGGLYQMPLLSWAVAGPVVRRRRHSLASPRLNILSTGLPVQILIALTMELPYFLMPIWASWLLAIGRSAVMRVVPLGIIVAGFVQILVSPAAGAPVFPTPLAAVLAPASVVVLHALSRRRDAVEPQASAPSHVDGAERAVLPVVFARRYLRADRRGVAGRIRHPRPSGRAFRTRDRRPLLVQICTGLRHARGGGSCCASWWTGSRPEASRTSVSCSCSRLPFAGLYLSHAIDGVALVVSVIPLNVVYADAAVLRLVRSRHLYNTSMAPDMLSMLVFFLKRVGILICPFFISMFTVLGVDPHLDDVWCHHRPHIA